MKKVRGWVSRCTPPPLDSNGLCSVFQRHIPTLVWTKAAKTGTPLFQGVVSFHEFKLEKHHLFQNQFLLKDLLQLNCTGTFNKSAIAEALETLDDKGAMRTKYGPGWGMQHGWFIIQCMAYLKKRSRQCTSKTEPWLLDLIMALRHNQEHTQGFALMDQDSQETFLAKAPTRGKSIFMRVSDPSCPDDHEERVAPKKLRVVDLGKSFFFNKLGNFATMVHRGEHIVSKTYSTNKHNHRIYLWPCGTTWTCTGGFVDGDEEEEEADGQADMEEEEDEADDGEEEEEEKIPAMKKASSILKKPMAACKSIVKPFIDSQCKKYKTTERHREHSKKYHQELKKLNSQGKSTEVAKQLARDAACKHVKEMFKA